MKRRALLLGWALLGVPFSVFCMAAALHETGLIFIPDKRVIGFIVAITYIMIIISGCVSVSAFFYKVVFKILFGIGYTAFMVFITSIVWLLTACGYGNCL